MGAAGPGGAGQFKRPREDGGRRSPDSPAGRGGGGRADPMPAVPPAADAHRGLGNPGRGYRFADGRHGRADRPAQPWPAAMTPGVVRNRGVRSPDHESSPGHFPTAVENALMALLPASSSGTALPGWPAAMADPAAA